MDYFAIAKVLKPQGIKGEVKLEAYVDDIQRFYHLPHVYLKGKRGYEKHEVQSGRVYNGFAYLKLADYTDRNEAELLREQYVYIDREHAAELDEDENYIADLIGLTVRDDEGNVLGVLDDVIPTGGIEVYQVKGEKTVLFPIAPGVELVRNLGEGYILVSAARLREVAIDA